MKKSSLITLMFCCMLYAILPAKNSFFSNDTNDSDFSPNICYDVPMMNPEFVATQNPATASDATVTVNVTVKNLTNITSMSHMLVWDPNVLRVNRTMLSASLTNLNQNINPVIVASQFSAQSDSTLGFSWIQFDSSMPQSLPNDATLYSIVFDVVGSIGNGTLVREFPNDERPPELIRPRNIIYNAATMSVPYTGVNILVTTSSSNANTPPSLTITSPTNGQNFVTGGTATATVNASDSDGFISGVEFFYDGVSQGIDNTFPYQFSFTNLTAGMHSIRALATDDDGATAEQTVNINVGNPNSPPAVSFIMPTNNQEFAQGSNANIQVSASDNDGTVTSVELFYDNISQGTDNAPPYQWTIFGLTPGSHNLKAVATDNSGATTETAINITVKTNNALPNVSFITPLNNANLQAGNNLSVEVAASDSDGSIANVDLYYDGSFVSSDILAPYQWTIMNLVAGTHTLRAVARDNDNAFNETSITINVQATSNTPPTVSFTAPTNGQNFSVGHNLNVTIAASDADGSVTGVELLYDGSMIGTDAVAPYQFTIPNLAAGSHTLKATATDDDGAMSETTITINVGNSNQPPTVSFSTPTNGQSFQAGNTLNVLINAVDPDGSVTGVELMYDGSTIGTDAVAPYQFTIPNLTVGTHTLKAIGTDNNGASSETTISINVGVANVPPTLSFSTPTDGQLLTIGDNLSIVVSAADSDGSVSDVELFYDGNTLGNDAFAPYQWTVLNLAAGTHTLKAVATDNNGAKTELTITIMVEGANVPPTLSFIAPTNGQNFNAGNNLMVSVNASDSDGSVRDVELMYDGNTLGNDAVAPYKWTIPNLAAGTHTLKATATDDDGDTSERIITINVGATNVPPIVSFIAPTDGQNFDEGDNLSVSINASDIDGSVTNVDLLYDGNILGMDAIAPYQFTIPNLALGTHTLTATATDDDGQSSSQTITIVVNVGNGNGDPSPTSNCDINRTFTNANSPISQGTYRVEQDITTSGVVQVTSSAKVVFQAGNSITFGQGFSYKPTGLGFLHARIESCKPQRNPNEEDNLLGGNDGTISSEDDNGSLEGRTTNDTNRPQQIRAYPNPVQQMLTVDLSDFMGQTLEVFIQDQVGKAVKARSISADHGDLETFDLSNLSSGLYILNVRTKDEQFVEKIVVRE